MKKRFILILIAAAGIVLIGYVAAGPFITIYQIKSAIQEQDTEKLSTCIDFPVLRSNLKGQFNAMMLKGAEADLKGNPFQSLAIAFASKLVEGMVDSFITPSVLTGLMAGKEPKQADYRNTNRPSYDRKSEQKAEPFKNASYSYDGPSKFSAKMKTGENEEIRFVFTRSFLSWRLTNIYLPNDFSKYPSVPLTGEKTSTQKQ